MFKCHLKAKLKADVSDNGQSEISSHALSKKHKKLFSEFETFDYIIRFNENLPKQCLDLLKKAKLLKKAGKISDAYTYDGQVCVVHKEDDEKFQIISSFDDLQKLE